MSSLRITLSLLKVPNNSQPTFLINIQFHGNWIPLCIPMNYDFLCLGTTKNRKRRPNLS